MLEHFSKIEAVKEVLKVMSKIIPGSVRVWFGGQNEKAKKVENMRGLKKFSPIS